MKSEKRNELSSKKIVLHGKWYKKIVRYGFGHGFMA